jgi:hypothetical protein
VRSSASRPDVRFGDRDEVALVAELDPPPDRSPAIDPDTQTVWSETRSVLATGQHRPRLHGGRPALDERMRAGDAEVVEARTEQPHGVRDCCVRDPAGKVVRIQELR